jgi:hypothetical protein
MSGEFNPSPEGNPSFLARRNRFQTALVKFIGSHTPKCREVVRILHGPWTPNCRSRSESSCVCII